MAFSVNTPVGDGTTVQFAVNFTNGIFSRDSVSVEVDGELDGAGDQIKRDFIWINDGLIELTGAAPASGAVINIRRIMDKSNPAVDYADGEILTEANLDRSNDQLLNAIQELSDGFGFSSLQGDINLNGNTITGIGTSALSSSAVTVQQLEDAVFTGGTSVLSDALSSDVPGKGASLVSMEDGPTVETAVTTNAKDILDRVIRATSVTALNDIAGVEDDQALVSGVPFIYTSGTWVPSQDYVTPEIYGADPSGVVDSASAIEAAIESGYIVDWGYGAFSVSRELGAGAVITHAIRWVSNGAKVTLNSASEVASVLNYTIKPLDHRIDGQITFDANNLATIGFGLRNKEVINYPTSFGTFYTEGLGVTNVRKNSAFRAGDGIRIEGSFKWVVLNNPMVNKVVMPTGEGTYGVSGVAGISVTRDGDSGGYSLYTEINNPDVTDVESLDLNYNDDQDGIQIFGGLAAGDLFNSFFISGGKVENAFGRSVKSQSSTGRVIGTKLIKNRGLTNPFLGHDIDFQKGEGFVDVEIDYNGFVPGGVVSQRIGPNNKASGRVISVRGRVTGGVTLDHVASTYSEPDLPITYVDNIHIEGSINRFVRWLVPNDNCEFYGENWYASAVLESAMEVKSGGTNVTPANKAFVYLKNVSQGGAAIPILRQRVAGNQVEGILNAEKVVGFTSATSTVGLFDSSESPADLIKTGGPIFPGAVQRDAFAIEAFSGRLSNLELFTLTLSANGVYQIWFDFNSTTYALITASSSSGGRITEISVGSSVAVDQLSEPTTGSFRVWCDNTGLLKIRNVSGSSRYMHIKREASVVGQ